jgi:signal transduction histidine kinase
VRSRILIGYLGLVVVVLAALEIPLGVQFGRNEQRTLETKVEHDATTIASIAPDTLRSPTQRRLQAIAGVAFRYRRDTGGRVVIVNRKGVAVIDTNASGPGVTTFGSRPEIASALRGNVASGTRVSSTLHARLLYVAVPVAANGRIEGAARITYPTSAVDSRIRRYWLVLAAIAAIVITVAIVVGLAVATFIARPLRRLEGAARDVGAGDLSARAPEHEGPPEVRSLAAVFNETVAKLDQLLRSQEEFVADASHQLRTPLTALRLRLENLARDVAPAGRAELDGAVAEVARLGSLVEALLALARADTSRKPTGRVDVDLVVRDRVGAWSALADERGVRLTTVAAAAAPARTSEERLRQVLDNLLENALEVSPHGGTITVEIRSTPPWIELRIRDEGPGLKREERERAFGRFWRNRTGEGSGLGLAIVRRLVEQDGGSVELLEAPGHGLEAVARLRPA